MIKIDGIRFLGFRGDLSSVETVTLAKEVRDSMRNVPLSAAIVIAKMIKEAYRIGEIRGQAVNRKL